MGSNEISKSGSNLFGRITELLSEARQFVVASVNHAMVLTYFEIGRLIVEDEQKGKERAEYGKAVLKELSAKLTSEFGKGYSVYNLERMRKFFLIYSKTQTVSALLQNRKSASPMQILSSEISASAMRKFESPFKLSWTHYLQLIKIDNDEERKFYEIEAVNNAWSVREFERQYDSSLYERLVLSRDKSGIKKLSEKGQIITKPSEAVKDPYVLDFLGLEEQDKYTESDLETAIINKLEHFLTELGKGFLFVGRQQ